VQEPVFRIDDYLYLGGRRLAAHDSGVLVIFRAGFRGCGLDALGVKDKDIPVVVPVPPGSAPVVSDQPGRIEKHSGRRRLGICRVRVKGPASGGKPLRDAVTNMNRSTRSPRIALPVPLKAPRAPLSGNPNTVSEALAHRILRVPRSDHAIDPV
jgi:hypothetical protein